MKCSGWIFAIFLCAAARIPPQRGMQWEQALREIHGQAWVLYISRKLARTCIESAVHTALIASLCALVLELADRHHMVMLERLPSERSPFQEHPAQHFQARVGRAKNVDMYHYAPISSLSLSSKPLSVLRAMPSRIQRWVGWCGPCTPHAGRGLSSRVPFLCRCTDAHVRRRACRRPSVEWISRPVHHPFTLEMDKVCVPSMARVSTSIVDAMAFRASQTSVWPRLEPAPSTCTSTRSPHRATWHPRGPPPPRIVP